jgi:SH3-like domain-containing protein
MHAILFQVQQGTGGLTVSDCRKADPGGGKSDWCLVTVNGRQGWIAKSGLVPE